MLKYFIPVCRVPLGHWRSWIPIFSCVCRLDICCVFLFLNSVLPFIYSKAPCSLCGIPLFFTTPICLLQASFLLLKCQLLPPGVNYICPSRFYFSEQIFVHDSPKFSVFLDLINACFFICIAHSLCVVNHIYKQVTVVGLWYLLNTLCLTIFKWSNSLIIWLSNF